jgi:hypothetical protein
MTARLQLLLDLDEDSNPISGCVRAGDGSVRPFVGYAELVAELEALRGPPVHVLNEIDLRRGVET